MKVKWTTIYVNDQEEALRFYTEVLGFVKKANFSNGPYRWLTVVSPEEPDGTELQLELNADPASKAYQETLFQQGTRPPGSWWTTWIAKRADPGYGRRVHQAARRCHRLQGRDPDRHVRQPSPAHPADVVR